MTYKGDIEYDRFRQMVFSMTDKGLLDMIEEITLEIRRRAEKKSNNY